MNRLLSIHTSLAVFLLVGLCLNGLALARDGSSGQEVQTNPTVTQARNVTTKIAFRDMTPLPLRKTGLIPDNEWSPTRHVTAEPDSVVQSEVLPPVSTKNILQIEGIDGSAGCGGCAPPDTNAGVGDTQVVETVNVAYSAFDKKTGKLLMGPTNIQTLFQPLGGLCATLPNMSDPTAVYDKVAKRWVITIIAYDNTFTQTAVCMGVSTTSDATGKYHLYSFSRGNVIPDYPKLGIWPDAYYLTTDSFPNGSFSGADTCALDRTKMLAGKKATSICFQRGQGDFALLPADLDGNTAPPAGAPNYEMDLNQNNNTSLNLYKFHVDFAHPKNSTFTGPALVKVAAYNFPPCGGRNCIPEPAPGEALDSIGNRLMFRLAYRNFGDHEALVATHSVQAHGSGHAISAVRWYEVRSPGGSPAVFQSGTIGGGASPVSLWMASIAMDKNGDIALGYSKSSKTLKPSLEYTGRVPTDPPNKMESPSLILKGTGVQEGDGNRWGDYSSMAIDPADDCTFWYTQEYHKVNGVFWNTRMASFRFTSCH